MAFNGSLALRYLIFKVRTKRVHDSISLKDLIMNILWRQL